MVFVYNSLFMRHNKRGAGILGCGLFGDGLTGGGNLAADFSAADLFDGGFSGCGAYRDGDPACENARFFIFMASCFGK